MNKAYFLEHLGAGADHLIWSNHKTAKVYGDLAKWIAPGTATAIRVYLGLDGMVSNLMLEPVQATTQHARVHYCFCNFGEVYFPGREAPAYNLIRKMFHTSLMQMSQQSKVPKSTHTRSELQRTCTPAPHRAMTRNSAKSCLNE